MVHSPSTHVGFKQQARATKKKLTNDSSEDAPPSSDDADEEEDEATDISPKSKTRKRKQLEYQVRKARKKMPKRGVERHLPALPAHPLI